MRAIFYGGPNHGRISHKCPNIPEGCKTIHGVALIVAKVFPKDSIYQSTFEEWTRLLSDFTLFKGAKQFRKPPRKHRI